MSITISVPGPAGSCDIQLAPGEILYVLGANGVGKSALVHRLNSDHKTQSRWIPPHRRTWLQSGGSNLTAANKEQQESQLQSLYTRPDARWMDRLPEFRVNMAIFDLIQNRSQLSQEIADAFRAGDKKRGQCLIKRREDPLEALSGLLNSANLPFDFTVDRNATIVATKPGLEPYSAAEMSDGERNALLLAAEVLTVPANTLILIDEPEQHLHRSIVSPLLNGLFSKRPDCMFVVSTHELTLPPDNPASKILLVRSCTYQGGTAVAWDVDLVNSQLDIDEDLKTDVLGARRTVVFVEGEKSSLDTPLYRLITPCASVIPRGTRKSVEDAVRSIRASNELHRVNAYGIVDRDGRNADDVEKLREEGIYTTGVYSVESIYFDQKVQEEVAKKRTGLTGDDVSSRLVPARDAAINAIRNQSEHLAKLVAGRRLREKMLDHLPNPKVSPLDQRIQIDLDAPSILQQERQKLLKLIHDNNLDAIVRQYPIRTTGALARISKHLGFDDQDEYARAVIQLLKHDEEMLKYVRKLIGPLPIDVLSDG
ncbi:MAG: AAA family ATPase [Dehalococcoidia bacterium]|nr:AAA family ATPase [Dehalococcoidia bacterium]